jgi:ubiquinone/menaquinone biosynthesis C-methylase UbiE
MNPESAEHLRRSRRQDAETILSTHPGILDAVVVVLEDEGTGDARLVAYAVPDDDYIGRVFAGGEAERKRVQTWRKTFDLSQFGKQASLSNPGFNTAGWNSSYTRQPIPAEHMREWVELTVQELRAFHPQEILEVGCGTGLLLLRLARECKRYVGTDFSSAVLKKVRKQIEELGQDWSNVTLLERPAEDFEGFAENSFDTFILNSVSHYFPSVSYLLEVIQRAIRVVKPGGLIFIGDVRSLVLLEPFAVSIELYQAPSSMSLGELRERVFHRIQSEEQLVISPEFFLALRDRFPKIKRVEVHPKLGCFDNEMTRFRYNAILHLDKRQYGDLELPFLDCCEHRLALDSIAALLRNSNPDFLAIKNAINARIENDVEALAQLASTEASKTVGELRERLERRSPLGIDPQKICALGQELGYRVDLSWATSRPDGNYDVVFRKIVDSARPVHQAITWPQADIDACQLARYANVPGLAVLREKLIQQLLDYLRQNLSPDKAPTELILMDALPMTRDGQVDIHKLPVPDTPTG